MGRAEMTYAETHKQTNGKNLFAGAPAVTGKYELTTLLFRPELDAAALHGQVDVKFSLYTEDDKGEALMDDFKIAAPTWSGRTCWASCSSTGNNSSAGSRGPPSL